MTHTLWMIFSRPSKNTVYDRVFDYVYGDVNEIESNAIIDADEKAEVKSVERSAEGNSQEAADINIEEEEAHQVYQQIIDRAYEGRVAIIVGHVDVGDICLGRNMLLTGLETPLCWWYIPNIRLLSIEHHRTKMSPINWGVWLEKSLTPYWPMRNSDEMTTRKTHPSFIKSPISMWPVRLNLFKPKRMTKYMLTTNQEVKMIWDPILQGELRLRKSQKVDFQCWVPTKLVRVRYHFKWFLKLFNLGFSDSGLIHWVPKS